MPDIGQLNEFRRDDGLPPLPTMWTICHRCRGDGVLGGYPGVYGPEDFEDQEALDDYMNHRRTCEDCHGSGKVRDIADTATLDEANDWADWCREEAEYQHICDMERRMGA